MPGARDVRAGRAYVELGVDDRIAAGLRKAAAKFKAIGATITNTGLGLAAIGASLLTPLGLAAKEFAAMGDEVNKASQRTGVAVETLSELKYAADQSGSSLEGLEAGLRKMSRTIKDAGDGSKEAKEALKEVGLTFKDLKGLSPDKQFLVIGDALSKVKDASIKAALAQELFGKSGTQLLPLLADGADGIRALQKRASELGLVIGQEDAEAATKFGDILEDLWKQAKMVTFHVGAAIAKALQPFAEQATRIMKTIIDWTKANRDLAVKVAAVAAGLVAAGVALVALGSAFSAVGIVLGGVATGVAAVGSVLGALLSPIGLVIAGLGLLAAWFVTSTDTGGKAIAWIGDRFNELAAVAKSAFGGIADALAAGDIQLAANILWTGLQLAWATGTESLRKAWIKFRAGFVQVAAAAFYGAQEIWANVSSSLEIAWAQTVSFLGDLWDGFVGYFSDLWGSAVNAVTKALNTIKGLFDESFDVGKANEALDNKLDQEQQARRKREMEQQAARSQKRDANLAQIEHDRDAAVQSIGQRESEISAAASKNAGDEINSLQEQKAELEKQLAAQKDKAAQERQQVATGGGPKRPAGPALEDALADAQSKIGAVGGFGAGALRGVDTGGAPIGGKIDQTNDLLKQVINTLSTKPIVA